MYCTLLVYKCLHSSYCYTIRKITNRKAINNLFFTFRELDFISTVYTISIYSCIY